MDRILYLLLSDLFETASKHLDPKIRIGLQAMTAIVLVLMLVGSYITLHAKKS